MLIQKMSEDKRQRKLRVKSYMEAERQKQLNEHE